MGQYADLFARIVDAEQDMPDLMVGEAEALTLVGDLANDLNGLQYKVEIGYLEMSAHTYLRVTNAKGDLAIIPFKIVPGNTTPELALTVGWGNGEARFDLATQDGYRRAAETIAQETLGQVHETRRINAIMRHFHKF